MPKIQCKDCARYTYKEGCNLLRGHYYKFRDCMTEKKDYSFQREQPHPEQSDQDPEEGAQHDRH